MTFNFKWTDGHTPKEITFPDGSVGIVQYMRDGLILFTNRSGCEYTRLGPREADITTIDTASHLRQAVNNYKSKQGNS